jgi:hypothetical protein
VQIRKLLAIFSLAASLAGASTIYGGFEDTPINGDRDFNDLTFTITGATLNQTGGVFTNLTSALALTNSGNPFWDNQSFDGLHDNVGDYWEGEGGYSGGQLGPNMQYLATATGGQVNQVFFTGGGQVTITGGITSANDVLEVCLVSNCAGTLQGVSGSLTKTFTGAWEVVAVDISSGKTYYSDAMNGQSSSFAFATSGLGDNTSQTPEPGAFMLLGAGLVAIGFVKRRT